MPTHAITMTFTARDIVAATHQADALRNAVETSDALPVFEDATLVLSPLDGDAPPLVSLLARYDEWREERADLSAQEADGGADWSGSDDDGCALAAELSDALRALLTPAREDRTAYRLTYADLDAIAGRELTDEEVQRVAVAIDNSTAGDAVAAAVEQVTGLADEDADEDATHPCHTECADGCGLAVTHEGPCLDRPGGKQVCSHPCADCGEEVELADPADPESIIHADGQPEDGHSAWLDA